MIIIAGSIVVILGGLVGCGLIFNCLRLKKKRNEKERLGKITFKRKSHYYIFLIEQLLLLGEHALC